MGWLARWRAGRPGAEAVGVAGAVRIGGSAATAWPDEVARPVLPVSAVALGAGCDAWCPLSPPAMSAAANAMTAPAVTMATRRRALADGRRTWDGRPRAAVWAR